MSSKYVLSQICIYPIKSLGGISLEKSLVTSRGLQHDRRWIVVDANGKMLTQRQFPTMTLMKTSVLENGIGIEYQDKKIEIPFLPETTETKKVQIWDDLVTVIRVNQTVGKWLSKILETDCDLYFQPDEEQRLIDKKYAFENEHTSLADGFPILIAGEASLQDLNNRLETPVEMLRFRPNLVFAGGEPYEEDIWQSFSINEVNLYGAKPCARCPMPTIDLQTAEFGKEPIKTLATYRKQNNKVYFGQNVLIKNIGKINIGDKIELHEKN
jgi:uncharacterized protein